MTWRDTLRAGLEALRSHRLRSGLTVLGILIGIAAVILTVGLGQGASETISSRINALGTNLLVVTPGSSTGTGGVRGGVGSASTLTMADAAALASPITAPDIAGVAPTIGRSATVTASSTNWTTTVTGTTPEWLSVRAREIASGRFLTAEDLTQASAVVVLGSETAAELFSGDPIGQTVTVNGTQLTVVGVLASSGSSAGTTQDDMAVLPITTAQQRALGGTSRTSVSQIYLQARSADALSAAYQEAQSLLMVLHRSTATSGADFTISTQESLLSTATSVTRTLTVLLAGIAAISLLVGGIGVMNIMLVSVTERVREIGLRKALGATPRVIRRQFMVEASMLGFIGGLAGVTLGLGLAAILTNTLDQPIVASPTATAGAIAIAVLVGIVSGVYPATRAARLAPIDALRSE
jgi:putative ABC transport system permease protein